MRRIGTLSFFDRPHCADISRKFTRDTYISVICRRQPVTGATKVTRFEDRRWVSRREVVAIICWFFSLISRAPWRKSTDTEETLKERRPALSSPRMGRKEEKKKEESRRMTRQACSILPTMLLSTLLRCSILRLRWDRWQSRVRASLCSYISLPLTHCGLAISPI